MANDNPAAVAGEADSPGADASRFGMWSEGCFVDDTGHLIHTYQVNVAGTDFGSPEDRWPLYLPTLVKICKQELLIESRGTLLLKRPTGFRDAGETLMSDPEEARVSRAWVTSEQLNDPDEVALARLRDEEANRGAELVGSWMKSSTNNVKSRHTTRRTFDRGGSGWLWCSAIMPTSDEQWALLCSDLPAGHDHCWTFGSPRSFARALGAMAMDQLSPLGQVMTLNHQFANEVTQHDGQTVFHGPVAYVDDPYDYVAESTTPLERLLRPLFVKRADYKHQREYRFVVWDEGEPEEAPKELKVSRAMLETTKGRASGPVPVPRSLSTPTPPPPAPEPLPLGSSPPPAADPLTEAVFAMTRDPHFNHVPRTISVEDAPADVCEKTVIYPAVETLRQIVGKAKNEPNAAAAAWHTEPYIRRLCAQFQDPILRIRLTRDNFFVIEVKFPENSETSAKIAVGPHGTVTHKIGSDRRHTGSTSGKSPHEGWPYLDNFEQLLEEYGLPRRQNTLG